MGVLVIPSSLTWHLPERQNGIPSKTYGDHGHLKVEVSRSELPSASHIQGLHTSLYLLICSMSSGPICLEKSVIPPHRSMAKNLG